MTGKISKIGKCEDIIYRGPSFISELSEELNVKISTVLIMIRKIKLTNKDIKMVKIFNDRIIFVDTTENRIHAFYKLRKKHKKKYKQGNGTPWRNLRVLIFGVHKYINKKHYLIVGKEKIPV